MPKAAPDCWQFGMVWTREENVSNREISNPLPNFLERYWLHYCSILVYSNIEDILKEKGEEVRHGNNTVEICGNTPS